MSRSLSSTCLLAGALLVPSVAGAQRPKDVPTLPPDYLLVPRDEFPTSSQRACALLADSAGTPPGEVHRHADVSRPAQLVGSSFVLPRRSGEAAVVFIVDTTGRPEPDSRRVIWATHRDVAAWAHRFVSKQVYRPAELEGRKVRQCVVLPFEGTCPDLPWRTPESAPDRPVHPRPP